FSDGEAAMEDRWGGEAEADTEDAAPHLGGVGVLDEMQAEDVEVPRDGGEDDPADHPSGPVALQTANQAEADQRLGNGSGQREGPMPRHVVSIFRGDSWGLKHRPL